MRMTYESSSPANATLGASIVNASGGAAAVRSGGLVDHHAGKSGEKMPRLSLSPGTSHRPPTRAGSIGMRTSPVGGANESATEASAGAGPQSPYVARPTIASPSRRSSAPEGALSGPSTTHRALSVVFSSDVATIA
jgi:hypothetical protein